MTGEPIAIVTLVLGSVNLLTLLALAFHIGRWTGRVEVRLDHLENNFNARGGA